MILTMALLAFVGLGSGCRDNEKVKPAATRDSPPLDFLAGPGETLRSVTSMDTKWTMTGVVVREGESELRIEGPNSSFVFSKAYPVSFSPTAQYALVCIGHTEDVPDSLAIVRLPAGSLSDGLSGDIPPCPPDESVTKWAENRATVKVQVGGDDAIFEIDAASGTSVRKY